MPTEPAELLPRWRVYIMRKRAEVIGTVHAEDEPTAVKKAIEHYEVHPDDERRLFARRLY